MKTVKIFAIVALFAAFSTKALCQDYKEVDGLKYKIFNPHKGPKPQMGDKAMSDMIVYDDNNTLLFNSIEKHQLIPIPIMKSQFKGDIIEGVQLLSVGDSAEFLISSDSIIKIARAAGQSSSLKPGSHMRYILVLRSISTQADQAAEMKAQVAKGNEQAAIDEGIIKDYIKANKIEGMQRTYDGLYYKITTEGTGPAAQNGQGITAHYTGKFLDGKVFDSDAGRPGPGLSFTLGRHAVIEGWDEAFGLMRKGSKAMLIIPSKLAYGPNANGPIPANAVLMFDVELADITPAK